MNKQLLIFALIAFLISCNTAPSRQGTSHEKANALNLTPSSNDLAIVYIVRDDSVGGSGSNLLIAVDMVKIVSLSNNSFTRIELPPGKYNFSESVSEERFLSKKTYIRSVSPNRLGIKEHHIRAGEINIVQFLGGNVMALANETVYGKDKLQRLTHKANYQVPFQSIIKTAKAIHLEPSQVKVVTANKATTNASATKHKQTLALFTQHQASAKCKLTNSDWVYTGNQCKNGMAHGKGSAIDRQGLKFIGEFKAGQRVKGEIHQNNNMIFTGSLVDDKPDGNAICFYEGEYEECRFFKGKRIDTLYKIRKENAQMKSEIAEIKTTRPGNTTSSGNNNIVDYTSNALQKEAADQAASFIFDQLF